MTTIPPGLSVEILSGTSYTANDWTTTTDESGNSTVLPVIVAGGGLGVVIWDLPLLIFVDFDFPTFNLPNFPPFKLPKFYLPCIPLLSSCTSPPVDDGPSNPTDNSPTNSPTDSQTSSSESSTTSYETDEIIEDYFATDDLAAAQSVAIAIMSEQSLEACMIITTDFSLVGTPCGATEPAPPPVTVTVVVTPSPTTTTTVVVVTASSLYGCDGGGDAIACY
jgi:hypothetical protein